MKFLDSFWLKIIALVTMIIDHIGIIFVSPFSSAYLIFRIIGRISLPIYAFLIIEGITHSKNPLQYLIRLILFGFTFDIICYLFEGYFIGNTFITFGLSGLSCYLLFHEDIKYKFFSIIPIGLITLIFMKIIPFHLEYGLYGVLLITLFFLSKKLSTYLSDNYKNVDTLDAFKILSVLSLVSLTCIMYVYQNEIQSLSPSFVMNYNVQTYSLIACFPMLCYNGLRGYSNPFIKWGFYISYPLHILILLAIDLLI